MGDALEKFFGELFFRGFRSDSGGRGGRVFDGFQWFWGVGERPNEWGRVGRSVRSSVGRSPGPPSPQKRCGVILHLVCGSFV